MKDYVEASVDNVVPSMTLISDNQLDKQLETEGIDLADPKTFKGDILVQNDGGFNGTEQNNKKTRGNNKQNQGHNDNTN